jgi:23S rRNA pseudouridine2604 synthase
MDKSLNKYISDTGFCSRREADKLIEQGRVTLNGQVAIKGNRAAAGDEVLLDGEPLKPMSQRIYLALNKPPGITCTTDRKDPSNIIDFIDFPERIFPIGRLDKPSEGLIFLTNDGDIVNKILRAGNKHDKEYLVTVDRPLNPGFLQQMANGVKILGTVTQKCFVKAESKTMFRIILHQGMNRQIRRMCEALGYKTIRLKRIRIMDIHLSALPRGQWRFFTASEIKTMNQALETSSKTAPESNQNLDGWDQ